MPANSRNKVKSLCVDVITMGCSKNLVDSERLLRRLEAAGFKARHNPKKLSGGIVVVNTCGFIGDAKQESIDMILECCQAKQAGRASKVLVMGCLSERYKQELPAEIPEVDAWYGKFDWDRVIADIASQASAPAHSWERRLTTPPHHAYLKIAEGCNRFCAYCAIPLITGRYASRPISDIVAETEALVAEGVTELNVIAQDLTDYGIDIDGKRHIAELVDALARVPGVRRIRLHYAYPTDFPLDLLPVMAKHPNVCKYLDIALQHISDGVLDRMRRHITADETRRLLSEIRRQVPGIHLRTTMMVGFPGETEQDFEELMAFVAEQRFERLGAFAYSEEDDTYAARHYDDDVPDHVKQSRLDRLMALQEEISLQTNEAKVGQELEVLIDEAGDEYYIGRTEFDSPEVDPEVLIPVAEAKTPLRPGDYCRVKIVKALPFELIGSIV